MNLAYKKILGKFTKVLGFGKAPPHVGKNSQMIYPSHRQNLPPTSEIFSIKPDLARSCFQFWLKIGDEGDKILKKNWRGVSRDSFFLQNFVTLGADFESQNLKLDLARSCFMLYTPTLLVCRRLYFAEEPSVMIEFLNAQI